MLLSVIIFLPLISLLLLLFLSDEKKDIYKWLTAGTTALQAVGAIILYAAFNGQTGNGYNENSIQFIEKLSWINVDLGSLGKLSIQYFLGVDGLNVSLILLSTLVLFAGAIASWNISKKEKGYFALYLLLAITVPGCFAALDFFLFFLFFEFMLLPMYFLIGMWGGARAEYASIKFFLYTLAGSILILLSIIALTISFQESAGIGETPTSVVHTFDMIKMSDADNIIHGSLLDPDAGKTIFGTNARLIVFLALLIGFAIKLPVFPLHTWLPDAHVEAPTPISVVLAGILLKIGGYGIIRTAAVILPDSLNYYSSFIATVGVVSIIYGAFNALAMKDLKKMIAYSSVSHMGFVLLGISSATPEGYNGAVFMMVSHGVLSSALFLITGVIYDRTGDRLIESYRGLAIKMPVFATIVTIIFFASLGLPSFSGFIAELFVLLGAFSSGETNGYVPQWAAVTATLGILLGATYFLWTLQKMFFGKYWVKSPVSWNHKLIDLNRRELILLTSLILISFTIGIFPGIIMNQINHDVSAIVHKIVTDAEAIGAINE